MTIDEIYDHAKIFSKTLAQVKGRIDAIPWYPHNTLEGIKVLNDLLRGENRRLIPPTHERAFRVLDIGAADGDIGLLFGRLGCEVDILENPATNFNQCRGVKALTRELKSSISVIEQDVDRYFHLDTEYDLAIALGILYHLRNPFQFLMTLALHCERMLLSTRIMSHLPNQQPVSNNAIAYLLGRRESNDDPTNYWILSEAALERLLNRSGWKLLDRHKVGAVGRSNPVDSDKDERMFVYCQRVVNYKDLWNHHDF